MFINSLIVLIIGIIPVLEIRGAIIAGISMGVPWQQAYILGLIGNLIPVPFLLILLKPVFKYMRRYKWFRKLSRIVIRNAIRKIRKNPSILKYTLLGLTIFVAIPIPGTGVWSGSIIAAILDMKIRHALPALAIGAAVAGLIVLAATLGFVNIFTNIFA